MIEEDGHAGRPQCALSMEADPRSVPTARQVLRAALEGWGVPQLEEDATLVTSELVDNAVRHSRTLTFVVKPRSEGHVELEVWDDNPEPPEEQDSGPESIGGRGLMIVGALASDWGWRPTNNGKVVWAVV
ncbi:hypothetical protein Acsp03_19430 [Actinomadura sp. NBRC 104412]|uniref:ATP-binding protein n=1 Tax=Actinomadura sp. NBRC 104412 TaxID=3032203 RepID=UPI0024A59B21|nr:ATP-binding protein [Actinomadura sp. NBRC 104412]GLZ04477.1 hypothetical protein Acsp03_19430 [Actinomadura sp. NBRC 104412]